jgi:hypothetical protein
MDCGDWEVKPPTGRPRPLPCSDPESRRRRHTLACPQSGYREPFVLRTAAWPCAASAPLLTACYHSRYLSHQPPSAARRTAASHNARAEPARATVPQCARQAVGAHCPHKPAGAPRWVDVPQQARRAELSGARSPSGPLRHRVGSCRSVGPVGRWFWTRSFGDPLSKRTIHPSSIGAPSSRGLGHRPFTPATRVRIPSGS